MRVPPNLYLEEAECCGERRSEGNYDRQADEGHHAGLAFRQLTPCPTDENETAVNKNHRSEDWSD
jgi:hypothetical protein